MPQNSINSVTIEKIGKLMLMEREEVSYFPFKEDLRKILKDHYFDSNTRLQNTIKRLREVKIKVDNSENLNIFEKNKYNKGIDCIIIHLRFVFV